MTQQSGVTHGQASEQTQSRPASEVGAHRSSNVVVDGTREPTADRHPEQDERSRGVAVATGSRIRGGPVWAGFVIGFATWILLELALFALDLGALAANVVPNADNSAWWWSGIAGAIAFFLGGLVSGASNTSDDVSDGVLHGITVWSLTVVVLIVLSATGAGIGFGVVGDILATTPSLADASTSAINDAQSAAGTALLALTVALVAAALGGALGAKIWPRNDDVVDLRDRKYVR